MKGLFISLEGIEGTGKSTQAKRLAEYLEGQGHRIILTAEPGGTVISRKIRELLLSPDHVSIEPMTELLLYNASRVQLIREVIVPSLEKGLIVITDRFSDSTFAYQGYGRGIDLALIDSLDLITTNRLRPDITFLLDLDVETGLKRNRDIHKNDRLEQEDVTFHERVRRGFHALAEGEPHRIKRVDCSAPIEAVSAHIRESIDAFLTGRKL